MFSGPLLSRKDGKGVGVGFFVGHLLNARQMEGVLVWVFCGSFVECQTDGRDVGVGFLWVIC